MLFRKDPFEGLDPIQICKKIYNYNKDYRDDINEIIELIGGEANFINLTNWKAEEADYKHVGIFPKSGMFKIYVKDKNKTEFIKQGFTSRVVGGTTYLFDLVGLEDNWLGLEATGFIYEAIKVAADYDTTGGTE